MDTLTASPQKKQFRARRPIDDAPNAILSLRRHFDISAAEVARRLGLDPSHIKHAERRGTGLGKENWKRLAVFFGVEPWELHDPHLLKRKKLQKNLPESVIKS